MEMDHVRDLKGRISFVESRVSSTSQSMIQECLSEIRGMDKFNTVLLKFIVVSYSVARLFRLRKT